MPYKIISTIMPEVLILEPNVFEVERGFFHESFNHLDFSKVTGLAINFVQDNHSKSNQGVLRGLHCKVEHSQGKLEGVIQVEVFDEAVDLRRSTNTFERWLGVYLSSENYRQIWVPPRFAYFLSLRPTV